MLGQNASVIVKRKSIQVVFDYCLDNKIETKMTPRDMPEEWELEFNVADIMKAISLGMFLKENKLELVGLLNSSTIKNSTAPTAVKAQKTIAKKKIESELTSETNSLNTEGIFKSSVNTENIFNTAPASATIESDDELPL
jgi:hypothetical protein